MIFSGEGKKFGDFFRTDISTFVWQIYSRIDMSKTNAFLPQSCQLWCLESRAQLLEDIFIELNDPSEWVFSWKSLLNLWRRNITFYDLCVHILNEWMVVLKISTWKISFYITCVMFILKILLHKIIILRFHNFPFGNLFNRAFFEKHFSTNPWH